MAKLQNVYREYSMQSLRGKSAKQKFIREYKDVRVLTYAALLNGNEKPSQCGENW